MTHYNVSRSSVSLQKALIVRATAERTSQWGTTTAAKTAATGNARLAKAPARSGARSVIARSATARAASPAPSIADTWSSGRGFPPGIFRGGSNDRTVLARCLTAPSGYNHADRGRCGGDAGCGASSVRRPRPAHPQWRSGVVSGWAAPRWWWHPVLLGCAFPQRGDVRADLELRLVWTTQAGRLDAERVVHGLGGKQSPGRPALRRRSRLRRRPENHPFLTARRTRMSHHRNDGCVGEGIARSGGCHLKPQCGGHHNHSRPRSAEGCAT